MNKQQILPFVSTLVKTLQAHGILDEQNTKAIDNIINQILCEVETQNKQKELQVNLNKYVNNLENLIHPDKSIAKDIIENLYAFNPGVIISLLAKMIAVELDQQYPDHILKTDTLYCISLIDGRIHTVFTNQIKNHTCVALFRTLDDAKLACRILAPILKSLYGKQKNKKH